MTGVLTAPAPVDGASYLGAYAAPLKQWLDDRSVLEIAVNPDGMVFVEHAGHATMTAVAPPGQIDPMRLGRQIAGDGGVKLSAATPLAAARMRWGDMALRAQVVAEPAVTAGAAVSLRKYRSMDFRLGDYGFLLGADDSADDRRNRALDAIRTAIRSNDHETALTVAVAARLNVLVSGGTSTAKTSVMRALIAEIDGDERIVTIEDAPELFVRHANTVGLVAERSETSPRSAERLLQATLRMRPDRIVVGELRGPEAWAFLEAMNTGHGGSMTTIHAETATLAIERLAMMAVRAGTAMPYREIQRYVRQTIDVIVQLGRIGGRRGILEIVLPEPLTDDPQPMD